MSTIKLYRLRFRVRFCWVANTLTNLKPCTDCRLDDFLAQNPSRTRDQNPLH